MKTLRVLERRPAIEAEALHSKYRELNREHLSLLAGRVVAGCVVDRRHGTVRKGACVEAGGLLCGYASVCPIPSHRGLR